MTANPQAPWGAPRPSRWNAGRIVALVLGILILLPGLGMLAGGGVLLWADKAGRTDDGFLLSADENFSTPGYALTSERIDLATGADWLPLSATLGTARVEVTGGNEVFIGVAPVADATAYLDGVERTVVDDLGTGSAADGQTLIPGTAPSGPPGDQDIWTESASGSGTQRLDWAPGQGDWMLVVMNADGSAGLAVDGRIGATAPALDGLAWGVLIAGLVATVIGLLLVALAIRRRPAGPAGPPYGYVPAPAPAWPAASPSSENPSSGNPPSGAPPSWTPPLPTDRTTAADATPDSARSEPQP
jgi:hypothetical protein